MHNAPSIYSVWVFLALAVVLTSVTLFIALKVMSRLDKRQDEEKRANQLLSGGKNAEKK